MNFFWKIFFMTMFVSIFCLAFGGYLLVDSNFHSLLQHEIESAYDLGDIVYYALSTELQDRNFPLNEDISTTTVAIAVEEVSRSISIQRANERIQFAIYTMDGEVLHSSLNKAFSKDLSINVDDNRRGYVLRKTDGDEYLQAFRPATFGGEIYYIETLRDVSFIFDHQSEQYRMLLYIMVGVIFFAGFLTYLISKLLLRRVTVLTTAIAEIASGNLERRVPVMREDEFVVLSMGVNRMADELQEKIQNLRQEIQKREMFVAAFSHELKTPLTSIIGYSDLLRRKAMNSDRVRISADYIFSEGKRLETLSMRLLDLLVLKNRDIHLVPTNIDTLFREISALLGPQIKKTQIELTWNVEPAVIDLEPELMKTVFINLIDNARKAVDGQGKIRITGKQIQDTYLVTIEDDGWGIPPEKFSKIREAFYQLDDSRVQKRGGAGLGLSICDQIIKLHGFDMQFQSNVNKGTQVYITMKGIKA